MPEGVRRPNGAEPYNPPFAALSVAGFGPHKRTIVMQCRDVSEDVPAKAGCQRGAAVRPLFAVVASRRVFPVLRVPKPIYITPPADLRE